MARPSWERYFMSIAEQVATRSTCLRRQVGCIIVVGKRIVSTGYNGAPSGLPHCEEVGCIRETRGVASGERHELCRGLHAEQNAIIQAAMHGTAVLGGRVFCTHKPCILCTKMLINAGVERVYYTEGYEDEMADEMARQAGLQLVSLGDEGTGP
ncbi:MAG: dCMP deaminase family protein [Actinomycetota bacterium]|nr:dCMP deaminase family protein [Actinomycetota bacterium]MDD5668221.1 dCMP deaminase family protein [Actinomycetota bacterium]